MYIRWLAYQSKAKWSKRSDDKKTRLTAILVESIRVDGKPRQRHIASLASIPEREMANLSKRCRFWEEVTRKLDRLGNRMSADDRRRIEAVLAERVLCPTRKQYDQWKNDGIALVGPEWVTPAVDHWPRA